MTESRTIKVRIAIDVIAEIEAAAKAASVPLSTYIRVVALKAARADTKYEAA